MMLLARNVHLPLIGEDGPLFVDCELDENNLKKSKEKSI